MPIYVYEAVDLEKGCDVCKQGFELFQSMQEPALHQCPECHVEIQRIIQTVGITMSKKHLLTDKNLKEKGFTKLVNEGNGKFRKI
jgi:putative FmdB family regulatory protein